MSEVDSIRQRKNEVSERKYYKRVTFFCRVAATVAADTFRMAHDVDVDDDG